ncbi:MAG: hypothetical protein KC646_12410 [Candidatus Cloacimonetes bacterium]|nr:hypothetical protein [Candidatus Cloacimonadota bacterium]
MTKTLIHNSICDEDLKQVLKSIEDHLDTIAWVLSVNNENTFRTRAWSKAKAKLYSLEGRLIDLVNQRALSSVDGIGNTIEAEIYHFLESNQQSHYLNGLLLEIPAFLIKYKLNHEIRNILAKVNHRYPCQSEQEILFFCLCDFFKFHQILYKQQERHLKNYFYQEKQMDSPSLKLGLIHGFYLHSPRNLKDYDATEKDFLNQCQWLFHPIDFGSSSEQVLIQNPKRSLQFKSSNDFEQFCMTSHQAIIDVTLCSDFFTDHLSFSDEFLTWVQKHRAAFLLPLDDQLYDQVFGLICKILQHNPHSGFLFSLISIDFLQNSPNILLNLIVKCRLSEKQILNFSSSQQILRFLQRFS